MTHTDMFDNVPDGGVFKPSAKRLRKDAASRRREADHFQDRRPELAAQKRALADEYTARADALDANPD